MHERTPRPTTPDEAPQDSWAIPGLAATLHADARPAEDETLGEGHLLLLGPEQQVTLELYPPRGVVRLFAPDLTLELTDQAPPHLRDQSVIFSTDTAAPHGAHRRLIVTAGGDVLLALAHDQGRHAAGAPRTRSSPLDRPLRRLSAEERHVRPPAAPDAPSATPSERGENRTESMERLTLLGRVGTDPRLRTTRSGTLVATFPLAVRDEADATTWHTIVAFDKRAEKVRDSLTKGQQVEIVGYRHERERRQDDGTTKQVVEVYAAVVKPR